MLLLLSISCFCLGNADEISGFTGAEENRWQPDYYRSKFFVNLRLPMVQRAPAR